MNHHKTDVTSKGYEHVGEKGAVHFLGKVVAELGMVDGPWFHRMRRVSGLCLTTRGLEGKVKPQDLAEKPKLHKSFL